jgi:hypothetical protein
MLQQCLCEHQLCSGYSATCQQPRDHRSQQVQCLAADSIGRAYSPEVFMLWVRVADTSLHTVVYEYASSTSICWWSV